MRVRLVVLGGGLVMLVGLAVVGGQGSGVFRAPVKPKDVDVSFEFESLPVP